MEPVHRRRLSCGKSSRYTVSRAAKISRTSSLVWPAIRQNGLSLSRRRRNWSQVGSGRSSVSLSGIVSPRPAATRHNPSGWSYCNRPWSVISLMNIKRSRERSCASSTMMHWVPDWCRCPMSLGFRVRQCPRNGRPSAVYSWSPSACSSSLFFGVTIARIAREPAVLTRSRIPMVLPEPGSATRTCQLRLCQAERSMAWNRRSKAVSTKISFLSRGWVMAKAPLVPREPVRRVLADQHQHLGQLSAISQGQLSWVSRSLTVREPLLDGFPRVGGPIGGCVRLDESLRIVVCVLVPLRSEYGREPLALAHAPGTPASHRGCAWLWLPIH